MLMSVSRRDRSVLNEDVLRHIASFLNSDDLARISHATRVFFDEHLKNVYTSLSFCKRDKQTKRFLLHLGYACFSSCLISDCRPLGSDENSDVALWVRRVGLQPWLVNPRTKSPRSRTEKLIILLSKVFDPDYTNKVAEKRLQKRLNQDMIRVTSAFIRMQNVEEYEIGWFDDKTYHPEFYQAFVSPVLTMWSKQLVKLTLKIPPAFLNSLAGVHLPKLETFCFTFSTLNLSAVEIDTMHTGFIVFVNNLKSSLLSLSFMSTNTNENFDLCHIFRFLGTFPLLQGISISLPYDGGQLKDPLLFVQFLDRHREELRHLSIFTNRISVRKQEGSPSCIEWIQQILLALNTPFPRLKSLAVALRPLRHKLDAVIKFLDNHTSTLINLKLMDRSLAAHEIAALFGAPYSGQILAHSLSMLHLKVYVFDPYFLTSIARRLPNLETLYIECNVVKHWSESFWTTLVSVRTVMYVDNPSHS